MNLALRFRGGNHARDANGSRGESRGLASAGSLVGPLTSGMNRREDGRVLEHPCALVGERRFERGVPSLRHRRLADHTAVSVECIGLRAKEDGRLVLLVRRGEVRGELRGFSKQGDEHTRRHGVERAGVTRLTRAEHAAHSGNDVVARHRTRFVDDEHARRALSQR